MMKTWLFIFLFLISTVAFSQDTWEKAPMHHIKEKHLGSWAYTTNACIDSALWHDYINLNLLLNASQKDSIPQGVYKIRIQYVVDKEGMLSLIKALSNPFGLGNFIENKLAQFPYKWSPATQNDKTVKSYHRLIIVFDI